MKRRLGALTAAMVDNALPIECAHGVIVKSPCTLCYREFKTGRLRRIIDKALGPDNRATGQFVMGHINQLYGKLTGIGSERDEDIGGTD